MATKAATAAGTAFVLHRLIDQVGLPSEAEALDLHALVDGDAKVIEDDEGEHVELADADAKPATKTATK